MCPQLPLPHPPPEGPEKSDDAALPATWGALSMRGDSLPHLGQIPGKEDSLSGRRQSKGPQCGQR